MQALPWYMQLIEIICLLALLTAFVLLFRKDRRETWLMLAGALWMVLWEVLGLSGIRSHLLKLIMETSAHDRWSLAIFAYSALSSLGECLIVVGFLWHVLRLSANRHRLAELESIAADQQARLAARTAHA